MESLSSRRAINLIQSESQYLLSTTEATEATLQDAKNKEMKNFLFPEISYRGKDQTTYKTCYFYH